MSVYRKEFHAHIGVLYYHGIVTAAGPSILRGPDAPFDVDRPDELDLWSVAAHYQLDQLWVEHERFPRPPDGQHWQTRGRHTLVFPDLDRRAPWRLSAPGTLYHALVAFNEALGVPYRFSPARSGVTLAEALSPRPRQPVTDWPAVALEPGTAADPAEVRALDAVPAGAYLHAFDKNAMYLAACSAVELGSGALVDLPGPNHFDKRLPGYWYHGPHAAWFTTPALAYEQERAAAISTGRAWLWQDHGRALRPWYERIRDARARLMSDDGDAARLALATLKQVYTQTLGWYAGRWHEHDSVWFRPDWRHMVMSTAHANMRRQLAKLDAAGTPALAWLDTDTLLFRSDEPDPARAAPAVLALGAGIGQFKHKRTLPWTDEIARLWRLQGRRRVDGLEEALHTP